jgi:hypothetical protein
MENVSDFGDVGLLVRLDSADSAKQTPEYVHALIDEAKRRGLLASALISANSPSRKGEFTLSSLSSEKLKAIPGLVTRPDYTSYMGLHDAVLKEFEERMASKAKRGDRIYLSAEKCVKIDSVEEGAVLYPMNQSLVTVPIQSLEPSPKHRRGCWVVNPRG